MRIIRNEDRGRSQYGWLDSRHTFSFADYYDPDYKGVSVLRVINDDQVAPDTGFETHSHQDVEIISYILEGAIEHKDSLGNITRLVAGDFQVMTTGTGVTHSEYNPSPTEQLRFLQIWIWPHSKGLNPAYAEKAFPTTTKRQLIASPDGRDGSLLINQNATLERLHLGAGDTEILSVDQGRTGMLHIVSGAVSSAMDTGTVSLNAGDAVVADNGSKLQLAVTSYTEALWFDLP
jgi:redox-sensitive bicupin YhaK (pirin superfamily)